MISLLNRLAAAAALVLAVSAHAATQIDRWSTAGGAWDDTNQTEWTTTNIINPDATADFGANLHASVRPSTSGLAPTGGLYDTFYYTFFTAPTLTLSTSNVLDGLTTVTFDFSYAAGTTAIGDIGLTLNFNASHLGLVADSFTTGASETISTAFGNQTFTNYSFTWNVAGLGDTEAFSLVWALGNHNSFNGVALTQTSAAAAVPEPSTYAAFAGLGVLALTVLRRRRAA